MKNIIKIAMALALVAGAGKAFAAFGYYVPYGGSKTQTAATAATGSSGIGNNLRASGLSCNKSEECASKTCSMSHCQ